MIAFVDTSALAKRYLPEIGSTWILSWILPSQTHKIVVSDLAQVEFYSLLNRRRREGSISTIDSAGLEANFLLHATQEYLMIPVDADVIAYARNLVKQHPLRALDAVQLASALSARDGLQTALIFVSADNILLSAAAAEGFAVDNPLNHP